MRRNPEVQFGSYMRQVESEMASRFGIGFSKLQQDIDAEEGPQLVSAASSGQSPSDFVASFASHYPIVPVSEGDDPEAVGRINRGIMALGTFARASEDWVQGPDGAAYRQDDAGVSRLVSSRDAKGGAWGFRAEHAEGAALDGMGSPGPDAEFAPVGGGLDIGQAIGSLDAALEARLSGPRLH